MKNKLHVLLILFFTLSVDGYSQVIPEPTPAEKIITELDIDSDGVICKQEAKSGEWKEFFEQIDTNDDNYLQVEEIQVYLDVKNERP